eukprot:6471675-Amphidinium_carterae.1
MRLRWSFESNKLEMQDTFMSSQHAIEKLSRWLTRGSSSRTYMYAWSSDWASKLVQEGLRAVSQTTMALLQIV